MWKITPLDLGCLQMTTATLISRFGVFNDVGKIVPSPCIAWLLTNLKDERKILVDAGPGGDAEWLSKWHNPISINNEQQLETALGKYKVAVEDIKKVILTHLHWDHAIGMLKLPNAEAFVQKKEIQYAVAPLRTEYKHYELNIKTQMPYFLKYYNQLILIDGDKIIDEGIQLITLPGHTPGSQGVVVDTLKGKYVLGGDLICTLENWETRIPGGVYSNMQDHLNSMDKIEQYNATYNATVLPSHDYAAFEMLKENL